MNKDSNGNKDDGEGKDKNKTQVDVPSSPPLSNSPKGNISGAFTQEFNQELNPNLIPHEALNAARDSQSAKAPTLASKPRWTRVCRVITTPSEDVSKGILNNGK
nr:hypothetical protein CFP56_40942 [Quercus suber]